MEQISVTKSEIKEVIENLKSGVSYCNEVADYQFILTKDKVMLKYSGGKYKFYYDLEKFARAIVRTVKRGY